MNCSYPIMKLTFNAMYPIDLKLYGITLTIVLYNFIHYGYDLRASYSVMYILNSPYNLGIDD